MTAGVQIGKSPSPAAVLPFYGTATLFFLLMCVLLFVAAGDLTGHYFAPRVLAVVHVAALGWGTMMIFGAAYQLLPVICEKSLFSTPLAVASFVLLTVGTVLLVWSFWGFLTGTVMIVAGLLVVAAALIYVINVMGTAFPNPDASTSKIFIVVSALWLLVTTVIGLLLAINLSYTFIPRNHLDILKLHAHAGLVGWFLQLIVGVSSKLVPMFLLGKSKRNWLLQAAIILQNLGLILFLVDGYFNPIVGYMLVYGAIVGLGVIAWLAYLADAYTSRVRRKVDILMRHTSVSLICLLSGLVVLPLTYGLGDTKWVTLYGTFLFLGWITAIILGMTFKTLPFIVWNNHYRSLTGKVKVPLPKQLYHEKLTAMQYYLYLIALVSLVLGVVVDQVLVIRMSLVLWILLAVIYGTNVLKVLLHKPLIHHGNNVDR